MTYPLLGATVFRDFETDGQPASGPHRVLKSDVRAWMLETERARTHGADIPAAATLNLDTATGDIVNVTGNVGISAVTLAEGQKRYVQFTGTPLITVGGTLVGNGGGGNIQVAAGDWAVFEGYASVVYFWLVRASGKSVVAPAIADMAQVYPLAPVGQCQLTKSAANLLLSPYGGNLIMINSAMQTIPDAGVTLAIGAAAGSTYYYIYAYMAAATLTLEFSATAPAAQAGTGIKIKTGDATRTLVGAAYTTAGPAWADTDGTRYVLSWFNRLHKKSRTSFTANRTTTSTTIVEINSEIRNNFISWAEEIVEFSVSGTGQQSTAGATIGTQIGFDGTTAENDGSNIHGPVNGYNVNIGFKGEKSGLSEAAVHYATLLGWVTANTATWIGTATANNQQQVQLTLKTRG